MRKAPTVARPCAGVRQEGLRKSVQGRRAVWLPSAGAPRGVGETDELEAAVLT